MITKEQLRAIMPQLPDHKADIYLPLLNAGMDEFKINTPLRQAAFLAQLAHESLQLHYFEEEASGKEYNGRTDLGNLQPGDGERYKGRGPIQLTGRANYREVGKALGLPLEENPEQAAKPEVGFRTAGYFWASRKLNEKADAINVEDIKKKDYTTFDVITRRINGGYRGKVDRQMYFVAALKALGVQSA